MIYIRQNTPFVLVWEIELQGTAIKLADTKVSVIASCARGRIDLTDYIDSIEENTITIKQNKGLAFIGDYSLMAIIDSENLTTLKVQEKYVFRAIAKIDPTETESLISIRSSIVASGGYDSALSEVSQNAIQNAPVAKEFGKVYQAIEDTENSIKQSVEDLLGGASEAYDTLKEIEEYIEKDEAGAVALAQSIIRLETEKVSKEDIDSALSTTSENPVMNKVITEELGNIKETIGEGIPIGKGDAEHSAVLKGEYQGYSNKALSKTSMAVGAGNIAGLKGWYYSAIDFANKKITLSDKPTYILVGETLINGGWSSDVPNIKVDDVISLVNDSKYDFCSKVTAISGNVITVDTLPFTELVKDSGAAAAVLAGQFSDGYSLYIPERPDAGIIDFGGGAFAEGGLGSKASNICAHAEGLQTHAYGQYSHAEGRETKAGYAAHAEGLSTEAIGYCSHAEGSRNKSLSEGAHAEGRGTTAEGKYSHSEGRDTKSVGVNSHAEGQKTEARQNNSHAEGNLAIADGEAAHAEGRETTASANYAHAEGRSTTASGVNSHAEGMTTIASGHTSHAEGWKCIAGATGTPVINDNEDKGNYSHAEGNGTFASGNSSHAEGKRTKAEGSCSHAEGEGTISRGHRSHAEGGNTIASAAASHAEGYVSKAEGLYSHAEGYRTLSKGNYSHSEGQDTLAKGSASHTEGLGTVAYNSGEHACGTYNSSKESSDKAEATQFSIGIGSISDRKNAIEVKQNGDIYVEGVEGRIQDKLNATDTLDTQLTELSERIDNLPQGDEFDKEGNYPLLHVGTADDLAGRGESVPAEFGFRASGGKSIKDGRAYIKRIKGNSVVWNQHYPTGWSKTTEGITSTSVNGKISAVGTNTETYFRFESFSANIANHKYLFTLSGASSALEGKKFSLLNRGGESASQVTNGFACIFYLNNAPEAQRNIGIKDLQAGITLNENLVVNQYDLTQMFQAGNEPTTIEEFNARVATLGVDLNAYNEGQVIHCNTESIKSVGDNAWDEEWELGRLNTDTGQPTLGDNGIHTKNYNKVLPNEVYYCGYNDAPIFAMFFDAEYNLITQVSGSNNFINIRSRQFTTPANAVYMKFYVVDITTYNNDILISLYHSGWKAEKDDQYQPYWEDTLPLPIIRKYFPDGMKKAGSAHDEIRFNKASGKWEKVVRIGEVDMGTLNWRRESFGFGVPADQVRAINMAFTDVLKPSNCICHKYYPAPTYDLANLDKVMRMPIKNAYNEVFTIKDTSYTDAASFKVDMAGVMLYYELAEPIVTELDAEDQNFRDYYNVADFGTEMSQSAVPSANFSADIIYQFNAVDMIREHEIEITELQKVIATMQAQLTSLINGGQ